MIAALAFPIHGFMNPQRLWVLAALPLLVALYIVLLRRKAKQGMRYTNTSILEVVMPGQSQWLRHITVALALLSLVTLGLAWSRPLGVDQVPRQRATVVVVVDVSLSMTATDVAPSRLEAAKTEAIEFISGLPAEFNVALVSLSGNPGVRMPPVTDHAAVINLIERLQPQESSSVGDALTAALTALSQAPAGDDGSMAPGMIVLLSDGANTGGQAPRQVALQCAQDHIPIYTIAFGTDNGYVDLDGTRQPVPPDLDLMRELAQATDGQSYAADNASQLRDAYRRIEGEVGFVETEKEITATAAGLSAVFAFIAAVGAVMLGARWR
ncbi:MAG: VWA domain-containing protein [Propionibacteriaceae bacterium]|jgi:Ca-activated chloride channel family protein|nr:VWA domain-containing protein [Propionibacteriaceae bacterium]